MRNDDEVLVAIYDDDVLIVDFRGYFNGYALDVKVKTEGIVVSYGEKFAPKTMKLEVITDKTTKSYDFYAVYKSSI